MINNKLQSCTELYYPSCLCSGGRLRFFQKRPTIFFFFFLEGGSHQTLRRQVRVFGLEHMVACPGSCHRAQEWRDERWLHPCWTSCYSKAAAAAATTTAPVTAKEDGEITTCVRRGCPDGCSRFITRVHGLVPLPPDEPLWPESRVRVRWERTLGWV